MKKFAKLAVLFLTMIMVFSIAACGGNGGADKGATVALSKTTLTLTEGDTERLTATTTPENEAVTFTSSDESIARVSATGLVAALKEGTATITATVTSSGNTATCAVTVNAQEVPALPSGEHVVRLDDKLDFERNTGVNGVMTVKKTNGVTTVTYDETAARDLTWQNYVRILLDNKTDLSRKTKVGVMLKGESNTIWFKVLAKDGSTVLEQEISATTTWRQIEITIPAAKRYMLSDLEGVYINVPRPNANNSGSGSVAIGGVWFDGDAEATQAPSYDYDSCTSIVSLDLSAWNTNENTDYDANGVANGMTAGTSVTGIYADNVLKFTNNGVSEWKKFTMLLPAGEYAGAKYLVITATGTAGTYLKGQVDFKNDFEFLKFDGTKQDYVVDVSALTVAEGMAISLVPSYLTGGATSSEITIHSIEIMK